MCLAVPCSPLQREIGKTVGQRRLCLDLRLPTPFVLAPHMLNRLSEAVVRDGWYCFLDRHARPGTNIRVISACRWQVQLTSSTTFFTIPSSSKITQARHIDGVALREPFLPYSMSSPTAACTLASESSR